LSPKKRSIGSCLYASNTKENGNMSFRNNQAKRWKIGNLDFYLIPSVHYSSKHETIQNSFTCELRLLLINVRGPSSFEELRVKNGKVCATYREACQELNILENDAHWDAALVDASNLLCDHSKYALYICDYNDNVLPIKSRRSLGKIQIQHEWRHFALFAYYE